MSIYAGIGGSTGGCSGSFGEVSGYVRGWEDCVNQVYFKLENMMTAGSLVMNEVEND